MKKVLKIKIVIGKDLQNVLAFYNFMGSKLLPSAKLFLILFFLISGSTLCVAANDTTKVLFIGNSFTGANDLPGMFRQLAVGGHQNVFVDSYAPGGVSVGDTAQGNQAHMNNPQVFSLIKSNKWDYVVLQDNSGRFVGPVGAFPSTSYVLQGHAKIKDSVIANNGCSKMIWLATWGPKAGYPPYGNTGSALINAIYKNYRFLNSYVRNQLLAPVGPAWVRSVALDSTINLWDTDDLHPSLKGTSLTANILYSTIFKSSAINSNYVDASISATIDSTLKTIAWQVVKDSLQVTGLSAITPTIIQTNNTLSVAGYTNCDWYLNDTFIITMDTLSISKNGSYTAKVLNSKGCTLLTQMFYPNIISGFNINIVEKLTVFPNPAHQILNVSTKLKNVQLTITNLVGQELKRVIINENATININDLNSGIYYLQFVNKGEIISHQKIIIE